MSYTIVNTDIPDVVILEPQVFGDHRGHFFESFNQLDFEQVTGSAMRFVQDNHSFSSRGVLRGLHYQIQHPQGKLVRVAQGVVFDVAVDLRRNSPSFGRWTGAYLSADNKRQLWIPPGCAHGFVVLSDSADFLYKTTDYWFPEYERTLLWNDPTIAIEWPVGDQELIIARKDAAGALFSAAEVFV